jgi:hypothetical protein
MFSIGLSILSLISILYVDNEIATRYNQADGKTKALFGIMELLQFNYKYFILIPATISALLTFRIFKLSEYKIWDAISGMVSLIAIIGVLTSSWKLLI